MSLRIHFEMLTFMNVFDKLSGKNPPVAGSEMKTFLTQVDFIPPVDYVDFMQLHNGSEGGVGYNAYLNLWPIDQLVYLNSDLNVSLFAPGYFIFGSDGAGAAFAFYKKDGSIVEFGLIGMLMQDEPIHRGNSFTAFVDYLYNY